MNDNENTKNIFNVANGVTSSKPKSVNTKKFVSKLR